jgi:DNA mismatch endonuclease (patch repair protein)
MDVFSREKRSEVMSRVRSKHTKPELRVRSYLHRRGLRFRLHSRSLPGSPDLVFPSCKIAVFVHGCFWHGHDCKKARLPETRREFWQQKIEGNQTRDARKREALEKLGWRVLTVWECEINNERLESLATEIGNAAAKKNKLSP